MGDGRDRVVTKWAVGTALLVATAGATAMVALRHANGGGEPEGRNWWIVVEVVMGFAFLPVGALLLTRSRRRWLGAAYLVVGASQLLAAVAAEWAAWNAWNAGEPIDVERPTRSRPSAS